MRTAVYTARDRGMANLIWRRGPLSRVELMEMTGVHRNLVGTSTERLLKLGLVREAESRATGPGRPSLSLEVNPLDKTVVGLSLSRGRVEGVTLSLRGERLGDVVIARPAATRLIHSAGNMLRKLAVQDVFAVGLSVAGLVDAKTQMLLFGSATASTRDVSLAPLIKAAGDVPVVLDNDQHALAARWLLTHRADPQEGILLVGFDDGRMGASHLVDGRPSRGCVVSANELGHTRLPVKTATCYCGHAGCLERICSSKFLHLHGVNRSISLKMLTEKPALGPAAWQPLIDALAIGFSNAVNFTRPDRLVLNSPLGRSGAFADALSLGIRSRLLPALVERVRIEWWEEPSSLGAENAAWLALASAFYDGWSDGGKEYDVRRGRSGGTSRNE